jgi:chromosome segregation ATPase
VFEEAANRVREARDEKERLQKLVEDSEGVEQQLRELTTRRGQREEAVASAMERVKTLEQLAAEAAVLSAAAEQLRVAREEVERIQGVDRDVRAAEQNVEHLSLKMAKAEEALKAAQSRLDDLRVALEAAEKRRQPAVQTRPRGHRCRQALSCDASRQSRPLVRRSVGSMRR